jgi:glycosyltransferase involved in cell wall biosynthesis
MKVASMEMDHNILDETFTILIPAYNEENHIGRTLDEICEFCKRENVDWKVVVSIDGSDKTYEIVSSYSSKYPFIQSSRKLGRGGKGAGIKRVLDLINTDFVILMDADGSLAFETILNSVNLLDDSDCLIFSRYFNHNSIPFLRRFLSRGFNILVRAFLGLNVRDTQSGYKVFKTKPFVAAMKKVGSTNAFFDVALLYYLKEQKANIKEVESSYVHRKESTFHPLMLAIGEGISLVAFRIRHSRFYKYVPNWLVSLYYQKLRWI